MQNRIAVFITLLFQPIFVPVYGMILLFNLPQFYANNVGVQLFVLGLSFCIIVLLPAIFYYILRKLNIITSTQASNREERHWAYFFTILMYLTAVIVLYKLSVEAFYVIIVFGVFLALLAVFITNFFWKISAHAAGMGGLTGAICFVCILYNIDNVWLLVLPLMFSGIVAWARLQLNAHTVAQLICGYLVGFFFTGIFPQLSIVKNLLLKFF